jgi:chemotaxis protein histidine kinase CheA
MPIGCNFATTSHIFPRIVRQDMHDSEKKLDLGVKGFEIHRLTLNAIKDPIKRSIAELFISNST